ncbi:MAG TPA: porin [bacterium]|nr:porin [bacterium]HNB08316.1 porin [bacterium]HNB56837.1 porin [bacterium]HNC49065.1 porin [bacterium]HNF86046.1 porin [bacterium]
MITIHVLPTWAQNNIPEWSWSGFVDAYYGYDFSKPVSGDRPGFLYNHTRHNEFNVNLALLRVQAKYDEAYARVGIMAGTYAQSNLSAEPATYQHLYEAYTGIQINAKTSLEVGLFGSHIGWESAVSKDNWTLSRSLAAENSPYYLSGVKATYSLSEKWTFAAVVCNGWQRIYRSSKNVTPAMGTQIVYKPSDRLTINYSTFVGNDKADSTRQWRYFDNAYAIWQVNPKLGITTGVDFGAEQKSKGSSKYNTWLTWAIITRYMLNDMWSVAVRAEQFLDKNQVIVSTGTVHGFQTLGLSANLDYALTKQSVLRIEGRQLQSRDAIFSGETSNLSVLSSLAISF